MGYIEATPAQREAQQAMLREIAEAIASAQNVAAQRVTTVYAAWPSGGKPEKETNG